MLASVQNRYVTSDEVSVLHSWTLIPFINLGNGHRAGTIMLRTIHVPKHKPDRLVKIRADLSSFYCLVYEDISCNIDDKP